MLNTNYDKNMKMNLSHNQIIKILKTSLYVGVSAFIGALISALQNHPELFGIYAPIVNVILVTIRQVFKEEN